MRYIHEVGSTWVVFNVNGRSGYFLHQVSQSSAGRVQKPLSMDWLKGKITGNRRFSYDIYGYMDIRILYFFP